MNMAMQAGVQRRAWDGDTVSALGPVALGAGAVFKAGEVHGGKLGRVAAAAPSGAQRAGAACFACRQSTSSVCGRPTC